MGFSRFAAVLYNRPTQFYWTCTTASIAFYTLPLVETEPDENTKLCTGIPLLTTELNVHFARPRNLTHYDQLFNFYS